MVVSTIDQMAVLLSRIKQNMLILKAAGEASPSSERFQATLRERLADMNACLEQLWAGMD